MTSTVATHTIIAKKRDNQQLNKQEIEKIVKGIVSGKVDPAQIGTIY